MAANESEERCYLPDEGQDLAEVRRLLAAPDTADDTAGPHLALTRAGARGTVDLPDTLRQMLVQAVDLMSDGQAVVVAPRSTMLTTQQAADILQVSRSTVTRLVADGDLPTERPGARRGLRLADVLDTRERRRRHQHKMLAETFSGLSAGAADEKVAPIIVGGKEDLDDETSPREKQRQVKRQEKRPGT